MGNVPTKSDETESAICSTSTVAKRLRDVDNDAAKIQKKQKIEEKLLRLMDMNYDCLEAIFMNLNLVDLVNVAEAHQSFIPAAALVFSRRFSNRLVYVNYNTTCTTSTVPEISKANIAAFFHHFGKLVTILFYNAKSQQDLKVEKLLLEHCVDSLVELELAFCPKDAFDTIEKPFENVVKLFITKSCLGRKISSLNKWFPSLTKLVLDDVKLLQPMSLGINISKLTHLSIYYNQVAIPMATFTELFRMNPQLKSLTYRCDYGEEFLRSVSQHLQQLINLEIWSPDDRFHSFNDEKFLFPNVETFTLNSVFYWGDFVDKMPFALPSLQELHFDGFNEFDGTLINFIIQQKGIKKLSLMTCIEEWDDFAYDHLQSIINKLPNLIELEFCADTFTIDELTEFLMKNKSLETLRLFFIEIPTCPEFRKAIDIKWIQSEHTVHWLCVDKSTQFYYLHLQRQH